MSQTKGQKKKNLRPVFIIIDLLCLLIVLEIFARLYIGFKYDRGLFNPRQIVTCFYPEMTDTLIYQISSDDDIVDVLILGASAVNHRMSPVGILLHRKLTMALGRYVRVFDVSQYALSSRDSLIKYRYLKDKHFDLILFYHGINETRTNNIPARLFKADYSHCAFYENINTFENHHEIQYLVFPWILHDLWNRVKQRIFAGHYIPLQIPIERQLPYGQELKSPSAFKKNIEDILDLAAFKNEPVVLATFAYYVPPDYSQEDFNNNRLDYTENEQAIAIEMWGRPENVVAALDAHNEVIRSLRNKYEKIIFVDQKNLMPADGRYFVDICHFSEAGSHKFVDNLIPPIVEYFNRKK